LLLQALGLIRFACSLPYLTHASFFALAHAGGSSSCCGCVVIQIFKIKTAVNNILQTRPSSSLVLEPKMYLFCVWMGEEPRTEVNSSFIVLRKFEFSDREGNLLCLHYSFWQLQGRYTFCVNLMEIAERAQDSVTIDLSSQMRPGNTSTGAASTNTGELRFTKAWD
jgi:hypothetical protein